MDFSQFDLTDPFVRRALAETLAEDNGLDYQDEYIRKALNDEIAAAAAPKPIDGERNFFGDTVSRLARGGVQLADTAIHAVDTAVGGSETLQGWSDSLDRAKQNVGLLRPDKSEHEEGWLKRSYGQALESAPMSAAPWAGAMAGASMGAVAGPAGVVAGGLIGGAASMAGLFFLGTYGQRKEEIERELTATRPDLTPDEISKMAHDNAKNHAFAETGGESAGDLASWAILSKVPGGQAIFKGGKAILAELVKPNAFKAIALGVGKAMPFEVGSEVGTAIWQNEADKAIGVEQGTSTDAALAAIGPAMFLSAGMGVAVGGYSANQRRVQYNALNSEDQESRAQAVDQVAGTLAEATDQQTAKKWRDMALGFVQNGQPIPLDMNLAELSANEPEVAAPEAQDQPAETILKAESVDEAIQEAEAEIAKPGWLAPTAPDLEESAWLQQGVAAKAYNQRRNELGATPVSRAGLLGRAMEPMQVAAPADPLTELLSTISAADQQTLLQMADGLPGLVEGSPELAPYQRQLSDAITARQRILWEESNVGRGKVSGNQGTAAAVQPEQPAGVRDTDPVSEDSGQLGDGEGGAGVEQASPLLTAARQHVAETGDMTMGGLMKALDVDIDTAEKLLEQVKATTPLHRNIGGTQAATVGADTGGFLNDQAIRKAGATSPATTAGDAQGFIADQGIRRATGTATAAPVADTEGFVRDQQLRRDAMGRGPKPTRSADEPARAFLARKREWEASVSQTGGNETQAELPRTDETQAGDQGGGQGEYDYDLSAVWRGRAPQVAAPTVLKSTTGGKEYAIPGLEELRVTVKPPSGNKAKHTKLGWSVYVGDNLIWANLPGVADTAENAINSARGKLKRIHAAIAKDQAHTTPKTTSTSDLPGVGTETAPSSGEASNVAAEMKKLVASIKKSDAKLEKLHEGQLNRMKNGGQSRATSTTYAARAGNEAKHRDGEARVLANIARAELRAGRAVPQDVLDILGNKIEYNRSGDYEPIEGVTAPSPGEAGTGFDPLALLTGNGGKPSAEEPARNQHLKRVQELLADTEREINDWATRRYKDNKKTVTVGGDVDSLNASDMEIGRINESRRKRTIEALVRRRKDLEAARDSLESDPESVEDIAADLKAEYGIDLAAQPSASKATPEKPAGVATSGQRQEQAAKEPWQMTREEYLADALERNEYRDQYKANPKLLPPFEENTEREWRRSVERAAETSRIPDAVLDSYLEKFGKQVFSSTFRGVAEKGVQGYFYPEIRAEQKAAPADKKTAIYDLKPHERTWAQQRGEERRAMGRMLTKAEWKELREQHKAAVQKALWNGEKVPASVLADYPELADAKPQEPDWKREQASLELRAAWEEDADDFIRNHHKAGTYGWRGKSDAKKAYEKYSEIERGEPKVSLEKFTELFNARITEADAKPRKDADMADVPETDFGKMEQPAQVGADAYSSIERELQRAAHKGRKDGDIEAPLNWPGPDGSMEYYVSMADAVAAARKFVAAGGRPVPFQIHNGIGVSLGDADAIIAALDSPAQAEAASGERGEEDGYKPASELTREEYAEMLKKEKVGPKNKDVIRQSQDIAILRELFEDEIKEDSFARGISRKIQDLQSGMLRNGMKVKVADEAAFNSVERGIKELFERAISEGKAVPEMILAENADLAPKEANKYEGFTFSKNDVSLEAATRAHQATSFSPDKRGQQEQEGYAGHMRNVLDSLLPLAKTAEQKAELREWFNDYYRPGYLKRLSAQLSAASRTMSAMITGPAKFPTSRNQKALDVESKRTSELVEWSKKSFAKMRAKLNGSEAISSTDVDAKAKLEKKLASLVESQEMMKAANKIIKDRNLDEQGKVDAIMAAGLSEKAARAVLTTPDFMGRIGFAPHSLQNNNAEIRRIKERIAELDNREQKAEETGGSIEEEFEGGRVELNYEDGYIRIFHDAKPDKETREKLKSSGFRWTPSETAWRRKLTLNGKYAAEQVTGVKFSEAEQAAPAEDATVEPEAETETAAESPTRLHTVSGYPSDNATKKHMLEAIAEARKELPEPSPKDGFSNAERIDWPKPTTEKSRKIYRLAGNFKLVVDPTGYARLVEDMGSSGKDGSKIPDKVHGKPIGNLAEAKLWAEYYLLGKTEPSGPPHVFRGKNKEYEYTIPNSAYALDNFEKKVKGSSGVKFAKTVNDQPSYKKGDRIAASEGAPKLIAGKVGKISGKWGGSQYMVEFDGVGKFVLNAGEILPAAGKAQRFKQISEQENEERVAAYIDANKEFFDGVEWRYADKDEVFERVVWETVGDGTLEPNAVDAVSLPRSEAVTALHISSEPENWAKVLQEDYERGGRYRVVKIKAMPGDIIVEDVQQAMPTEMFGRMLDSGILVTGRETLKRGRDGVYKSTTALPPSARADIPGERPIKLSSGTIEALEQQGFKIDEKAWEDTDELAAAVNYAFEPIPWRLPNSLIGRDRKGRVEQAGTPRSDFELTERLAKIFNKRVIWTTFGEKETINGLVASNLQGRIFLNPLANNPSHVVFGHELSHWLELEHPAIYADLYEAVEPLIIYTEEYRKRFEHLRELSDYAVNTEIIGDLMGDAFADQKFWNLVAEQAGGKKFKGIVKKIIRWINSIVDRLAGLVGYNVHPLVKDLRKTKYALARAVARYGEASPKQARVVMGGGIKQSVRDLFKPVDTESAAFKRWFGDSKVVDADGKPLVVYTGTDVDAEIEEFNIPAYFTESKDEASAYTFHGDYTRRREMLRRYSPVTDGGASDGQRVPWFSDTDSVLPEDYGKMVATDEMVFKRIKGGRYLIYTDLVVDYESHDGDTIKVVTGESEEYADLSAEAKDDAARYFAGGENGRVYPVYLAISNPKKLDAFEANVFGKRLSGDDAKSLWEEKVNELESAGYDGIETESDEARLMRSIDSTVDVPRQWLPFRPNQIKSAISNTGDFSPSDPRIRYSKRFEADDADERNPPPLEGTTTEDPYEQAAKIERNKYLALRRSTSATLKSIAGGVDKYLGAISTRLRNISPKLEHKIRQLDFNIGTNHTRDVRAVEPLLKLAKQKMSKMDFIIWDLARKNSDVKRIDDLVKKYGIRKEYDAYRKVLDRVFKEAQEVGIELGWINEYAPRVIKDAQGFLNELGRGNDWPVLTQKLKEVARRMDITVADMTPEMKADIISNMLFSGYYGMGAPGSTKERSIAMIPPKLNQYYMDSDAALMQYLHSMRKHIEARRFFGKVPQKISEAKRNMHAAMKRLREEEAKEIPNQARMEMWRDSIAGYRGVLEKYKNQRDYTDNIAQYVIDLMESGELSPENENVLKDILNARFNEHGTRGVIQAYKNFSYLDTMGSPISAITQIGDLAWSIYANGWTRTLRGISKSALGKAKITKEDVGIERIAQEFADTDTLSKAVAKVFRWIGLEKMDTIGKESFLNGAFERFVAEAKKDPKALERKLEQTFEEDAALVVDDLQNERITENVKLLVYSDLLNFQPAAMSEMPEQYLLAGNGRLFYMLKTYTLKQFDVFRREGYNAIRSGTKTEKIDAIRKVAYLAMLLVLANGAADELKDWLLGRKTDLSDRVTDNVLRLFGVSKYMTWKARTEGYGSAIVRQILPPFKFVDSLSKDILSAGDGKGLQTPQSVPVVGKLAYWHLGRGKDAHRDLWEIRFSKERRRLEEIKERVEENPDLASKYRQEMRRLKAFRRAQYRINQMKSASNKLRQTERRTGSDYSARIDAVEQRRIAAIKRFLGAQQ
jgi:hypothetical protein